MASMSAAHPTLHFFSRPLVRCFYLFLFHCYGDHRDLHSFPTRRSSDRTRHARRIRFKRPRDANHHVLDGEVAGVRSEEHTCELQSRFERGCRLLLEKKKMSSTTAGAAEVMLEEFVAVNEQCVL